MVFRLTIKKEKHGFLLSWLKRKEVYYFNMYSFAYLLSFFSFSYCLRYCLGGLVYTILSQSYIRFHYLHKKELSLVS